jgi:hypothetical protein
MNAYAAVKGDIHCHMAAMKVPPPSLEDRILKSLEPMGVIKTFDQINMFAGGLDPVNYNSPEEFSQRLDKKLQGLIARGKVLIVARRPELCFRLGTVLDRIIREIELDG